MSCALTLTYCTKLVVSSHHESQAKIVIHRRDSFVTSDVVFFLQMLFFFRCCFAEGPQRSETNNLGGTASQKTEKDENEISGPKR